MGLTLMFRGEWRELGAGWEFLAVAGYAADARSDGQWEVQFRGLRVAGEPVPLFDVPNGLAYAKSKAEAAVLADHARRQTERANGLPEV